MSRMTAARLAIGLCALLGAAACDNEAMPGFLKPKDTGAGAAVPGAAEPLVGDVVEQDVEDPAVFSVTEKGLWDGRPSLGGVWVAHPDVKEPERVVIRNASNGKSVIGALFRRERDAPGPRLQVSSDAADALGILAGAPAELSVVALVRREIEVAPPKPAEPVVAAAAPASQSADADAAAITAGAAAAIAAAETGGADAAAGGESAAAPAAKTGGFFSLFRRKAAAAPEAAAGDGGIVASPLPEAAAVEQTTLPAPSAAPAPAASAAPAAAAATASAPAAPAPAPTGSASAPERPYIQIGIFAQEANATETADMLRAAGIVPDIRKQASGDKTFWRVLAGPATSRRDLDALLEKVKSLGFNDAYFVRG